MTNTGCEHIVRTFEHAAKKDVSGKVKSCCT